MNRTILNSRETLLKGRREFQKSKRGCLASTLLILIITLAGCDEPRSDVRIAGIAVEGVDEVTIVAHRGAMAERPENTIVAFQRAVEIGADIVEIDVRTSRDGHLFILHDESLDRTTDADGQAADRNLEELQQLDAGSWFDPEYIDQTIPSLQEVLDWALEERTELLLDLKESGRDFAMSVAEEVEEAAAGDLVIIGVRSPEQAVDFREQLPESRQLGFIGSPDDINDFADAGVDVIRLWLSWLKDDPSLAGQVRQAETGLMINGSAGQLEETREIMNFGPDWVLIDDPVQLQYSLDEILTERE